MNFSQWPISRPIFIAILCVISQLGAQGSDVVYFLVGPAPWLPVAPPLDDSYVLPIPKERPNDVEHARSIIAVEGRTNTIIAFARIQVGADGINHNLMRAGLPAWHWHVTEFIGFGNQALDTMSGHPAWIEQNPEPWVESGIALVTYTVARDLGEEPIFVRANRLESALQLNWWSPGTNLVFTVESTASITAPDWKAVPGPRNALSVNSVSISW